MLHNLIVGEQFAFDDKQFFFVRASSKQHIFNIDPTKYEIGCVVDFSNLYIITRIVDICFREELYRIM